MLALVFRAELGERGAGIYTYIAHIYIYIYTGHSFLFVLRDPVSTNCSGPIVLGIILFYH